MKVSVEDYVYINRFLDRKNVYLIISICNKFLFVLLFDIMLIFMFINVVNVVFFLILS